MRRRERAAYRTKFYSNLSSPTRFDEEPLFFQFEPKKKPVEEPTGIFLITTHIVNVCFNSIYEHIQILYLLFLTTIATNVNCRIIDFFVTDY